MKTELTASVIPTSRRFFRDERHPYGWKVGFRQTVKFSDGRPNLRTHFSDIGIDRWSAIGNALRRLNNPEFLS